MNLPHNQNAILFFASLLLTFWLTPVVTELGIRYDAVDQPGGRKTHRRPVARLGGVALAVGVFLPLLVFHEVDRIMAAYLAGAALVVATGLVDDVFTIRPAFKFAGEAAAAAVFVLAGGASLPDLGDLFGFGAVSTGHLAAPVAVFCMVGVMNAVNLADGLDGLAGGIAALACFFLGMFAYREGDWFSFAVLVALFGAIMGFLRFNTFPARIFMGDAGSLLLGYSLSAVAVVMARGNAVGAELSPVMVAGVLALQVTDTLLVMVRRIRHGQNPFLPDRTHLHHRLMDLGLSHASSVAVLYSATALLGIQALLLRVLPEPLQFMLIVLMAGTIHLCIFAAARWWKGRGEPNADPAKEQTRFHVWISRLLGKSTRPMSWGLLGVFLVPLFAAGVPERFFCLASAGMAACLAALFPWRNNARGRSSVSHGLLFAACLFLISCFQFGRGIPAWVPPYFAVVSAAMLIWALLKMKYRAHTDIALLSSFEILIVAAALAAAIVAVPVLGFPEGSGRTMIVVWCEALAFLLAMKVAIRHRPRRRRLLALVFVAVLTLVAVKGFFGGRFEDGAPTCRTPLSGVGGYIASKE